MTYINFEGLEREEKKNTKENSLGSNPFCKT
jgi:hypothetical protein